MHKQVIIIRKDLNMRKGKMVAQGAHAAIGAYLKASSVDVNQWKKDKQTKICVSVDSELELHSMVAQAQQAGLPHHLVLDAGKTEFDEPTYTAVAIGPADEKEVDKITHDLDLL